MTNRAWNTTLDVFSDFPQRCAWFQEQIDHTPHAYEYEDGTPQTAFYCEKYRRHRIVEEECLGEGCDCCKLVGIDEYEEMMH